MPVFFTQRLRPGGFDVGKISPSGIEVGLKEESVSLFTQRLRRGGFDAGKISPSSNEVAFKDGNSSFIHPAGLK
ncbi:hypothetical protein [Siccibacter turicensis]|uniref:hypothetical protein n=1 Tax=Siccibacter turicensis TaxID=357233 RepID=UPI0010212527|nr:hypothetical protein [Siccibacter turicensis]